MFSVFTVYHKQLKVVLREHHRNNEIFLHISLLLSLLPSMNK